MEYLWTLVVGAVCVHVIALILYLNWTRVESAHSSARMSNLVASFAERQKQM